MDVIELHTEIGELYSGGRAILTTEVWLYAFSLFIPIFIRFPSKHVIKYGLAPHAPKSETAVIECFSNVFVDESRWHKYIPHSLAFFVSGDEGADVGSDIETAVPDNYKGGDNKFTGFIVKVTIDISPTKLSAAGQRA